jgi:hypothetical protein
MRRHQRAKIPDAIRIYGSFVELPDETDQLTLVAHAATSVRILLLFTSTPVILQTTRVTRAGDTGFR